jgi:hypothetical protein
MSQFFWFSLVTASAIVSAIAPPTFAQSRLGQQVIQFSEDTIVEFEVQSTQGANRAEFGIMADPGGARTKVPLVVERQPYDDFGLTGFTQYVGTVNGGTVQGMNGNGARIVTTRANANQGQGSVIVEYLFEANVPYVFYLDVYTATEDRYINTFISTDVQTNSVTGALDDGRGVIIAWEDDGEGRVTTGGSLEVEPTDLDFDDVVVFAGGQLPCVRRSGASPNPQVVSAISEAN